MKSEYSASTAVSQTKSSESETIYLYGATIGSYYNCQVLLIITDKYSELKASVQKKKFSTQEETKTFVQKLEFRNSYWKEPIIYTTKHFSSKIFQNISLTINTYSLFTIAYHSQTDYPNASTKLSIWLFTFNPIKPSQPRHQCISTNYRNCLQAHF